MSFYADLQHTASEMDRRWPGSGKRYARFVTEMQRRHERLRPLLLQPRPRLADLWCWGAWRDVPFLLRSLGSVLAQTGLPQPIIDAIAIWTHVAGQRKELAPSPLAFVPALFHSNGAYYPTAGIGAIPKALAAIASQMGATFRYNTRVRTIRIERGRVCGVETEQGEFLFADAVISNASGVGTYLQMVNDVPEAERRRLQALPLQSPGVCAYLAVKGTFTPPYLRFYLPEGELCRLLILPGLLVPELQRDGWQPARLLAPMDHAVAEQLGPAGQRAFLDRIVGEKWWQGEVAEYRILATRIPAEWGAEYHLYRESMNPVMTARFMRAGRLAHRSPYIRGLYLAGSSTHPGQWVSFCAVSGVLAADCIREDLSPC